MKRIRSLPLIFASIIVTILLAGCAEEKTPSRDQIPFIKERISRLQRGIEEKNTAAIDSLMSVDILKKKLTSDSLLNIVYGSNSEYEFKTFGHPEIVYTDDFASIEIELNDSTHQLERLITFTFVYDDGQWLLIDFKTGHSGISD